MAERKFLDFLDMFDGGGAGQMGDKFEGGGLISALGNLVASPYGSQDEERKKARMAFYGPSVQPTLSTQSVNGTPQRNYDGSGMTPATAYVGTPQRNYDGSGMTPATAYVGPMPPVNATSQRNIVGSGMNPLNAYVDPMQRFAEDLIEMYGPDTANMVLNSGIADQAFRSYVERGYKF